MSSQPEIVLEEDAPPIVRVLANNLRLALVKEGVANLLDSIEGTFSLVSTRDPQKVTVTVGGDKVRLSSGVSSKSKIVIHLDFDRMSDPTQKPMVVGLYRHPWFAYKVGKLLAVPLPNWADSAKRFWAAAADLPDVPSSLKITCTDEQRSLVLGEESEGEEYEIVADSNTLAELFAGNTILVNEVLYQKIRAKLTMQYLAGLSNAGVKLMLGEIHG